ncbi:MAG: hypothetical protein C0403_00040 [Desulfobacterium sp.]|nr:hypothetical protein [Desulfobacterium sp.]
MTIHKRHKKDRGGCFGNDYMTIFINGKQKRVKKPLTIDGMDCDEFIYINHMERNHDKKGSCSEHEFFPS